MKAKAIADLRIAVAGLGYVGLPLAVAFARMRPAIGFDISQSRIGDLILGYDHKGVGSFSM